LAGGPGVFEGHETLIFEVELEDSAVCLAGADCDRGDGDVCRAEPRVLLVTLLWIITFAMRDSHIAGLVG
jgi:hypothetical protein